MPVPQGESQFASDRGTSNVLLYLGIGCGALVLLVIAAGVGIGVWGYSKASHFVSEFQANPERFAAEMIVNMDPDLELVASNDATGEITIHKKSSGETLTLSYSDVAEGKLTVSTKGPDGTTTAHIGTGQDAPAWFPVMEGLTISGSLSQAANGVETIHLSGSTDTTLEEVTTYYSDELDKLGFTISRQSQTAGAMVVERIEAVDEAGGRRVTLTISRQPSRSQTGVVVMIEGPATP